MTGGGMQRRRDGGWRTVHGLAVAALLFVGLAGAARAQAPALRIAGTGDSEDVLREAARLLAEASPPLVLSVPDSIGSTGGIKAVLAGQADLARAARPLREAEKAQGLVEWVFAETPVVFAVNPAVTGLTGLTAAQVLDIYAGRITDWAALGGPAGPIRRVTRETPETSREVLDAAIPGFAALGTDDQAVAYSTPEAVELVRRHAGAIGYFSLTAMTGSGLVPLALGGVPPTPEALADAPNAPRLRLSLVYRPPLSPAGARLAAFLLDASGQALLGRYGCRPLAGPATP